MKKALLWILAGILSALSALLVIYSIDSANRTQEKAVEYAQKLMSSICKADYEHIRFYLKNEDGSELNDEEVTNFLLNTGLYRATLTRNDEWIVTYSAKPYYLRPEKECDVSFQFAALNGDIISCDLKYVNTGIHAYLITDQIQQSYKELESYPIEIGIPWSGDDLSAGGAETEKLHLGKFVKNGDGEYSLEIIQEAKEDLKLQAVAALQKESNYYHEKNERYRIEWNEDYTEFSVYCEKDINPALTELKIMGSTIVLQALDGKPKWELTIHYYDSDTQELLRTEKVSEKYRDG